MTEFVNGCSGNLVKHDPDHFRFAEGFLSRTPAPPPFSSMNSTCAFDGRGSSRQLFVPKTRATTKR